jgi:hypothetical protein
MSVRLARRGIWILAVLGLIAAGIFLPPLVNANRYRIQVASAISNAIGRGVSVSNVEVHLIPRPAVVLSTFILADDPAFGVEPMLRADTVTAYIRLSSLWRRHLEIGTLSLENPSLNLVRRADGRWNIEGLVQRSSQVPSAPTGQKRPESRPRFPYVEATAGRINFKFGQVKKAFAFADADFALWMESENEWGVRLEARPMRSDVPVRDTGLLKIEGRFQRAPSLRDTPLTLKADFSKGQLGQVTTLIYGRDRGWRGSVASTATMAGTPASLAVTLDSNVDDFRRYDIALGQALRLSVHCVGTYSSPDDSIRGIQCQSPMRSGSLMLRGDITGWPQQAYNIGISGEQIPLDRIVALARHTKKDLPEDLTATGSAEALFTVRKDMNGNAVWEGGGRASNFALQSKVLKQELEIGMVEFTFSDTTHNRRSQRRPTARNKSSTFDAGLSPRLVLTPFPVSLGAPSPATVSGFFDLQRYRVAIMGNAELARLLDVARAMGIRAPGIGLAGRAQLDMEIAGAWTGFAPPAPSGKLQIHNASAELKGVLEPLQVDAANVTLADQTVAISAFSSQFKDGPVISGSASFPLGCQTPSTCVLHFDLHTPEISLSRLNQLLNPSFKSRPWYHLSEIGERDDNAFLRLQAQGRISGDRCAVGSLIASNVTGTLTMKAGAISFKSMNADVLGGHHIGNWDADFSSQPPKFFGSGTLTKVAMTQLGALMHDPWASGTLDGQYTLGLAGADSPGLRDSANGSASFIWSGGTLRHITLEGRTTPLSFSVFKGQVLIRNGVLSCESCPLKSSGDLYQVKGTASFARNLDLRLEGSGDTAFTVSGPLEKPRVEAVPVPSPEAKLR